MIVWDLGGVLTLFDPAARLTALAAATRLPAEHIDHSIWGSGLDAAAERGALDEETCWSETLTALDHRIDRTQLRRCWALAFTAEPAVLALIDKLGRPAALFTDNGPILEACLRHELASLSARFQHSLLSWRLGATKSDPVAYHRAASALEIPPADLTLIDDRITNVTTARQAGWQAIHFTTIGDLEPQL